MNVFKAAAPLLASVALVSSPAMAQVEVQTFIGEDGISYILDTERYPASYYLVFGPVPLGDGPMNSPRIKNDFAGADRINAELVRLGQVRIGDNVYDINQGCEISRDYYTNMYSPDYVSFQIFTGGFCEDTGESSEDVRWVSYDMQSGEALDYAAIVPGLKLVAPDYDYEPGQIGRAHV